MNSFLADWIRNRLRMINKWFRDTGCNDHDIADLRVVPQHGFLPDLMLYNELFNEALITSFDTDEIQTTGQFKVSDPDRILIDPG